MRDEPKERSTDPILLIEVVLGLGLLGLFIVLYLIPAEQLFMERRWWSPLLLGILFFGLLGLDAWRRRRRQREALRAALREQRKAQEL